MWRLGRHNHKNTKNSTMGGETNRINAHWYQTGIGNGFNKTKGEYDFNSISET